MVHKIKIASTIHNINEIEFFFKNLFQEISISRKLYCRIYLSVIEAVTNAIIHGNKINSDQFVTISFYDRKNDYLIKVEDEGNGFDYDILPNPLDKVNILKESGRGIFIIKQYSDKVIFEKNGSCLNLIFNK